MNGGINQEEKMAMDHKVWGQIKELNSSVDVVQRESLSGVVMPKTHTSVLKFQKLTDIIHQYSEDIKEDVQ